MIGKYTIALKQLKYQYFNIKIVFFIIIFFTITNCTSPEFIEQTNICKTTWMEKIPPKYEQENYLLQQSRQVPTGQTNCTTSYIGNYANTTCNQVMKTEYYNVPAIRTVDRNKSKRDKEIASCRKQNCTEIYGNPQCETE